MAKTGSMNINQGGIELIKHFESCLEPTGRGTFRAYADPGLGWKLPTIGWGTVAYDDGTPVKRGDIISQERADELLAWEINQKAAGVSDLVKVPLTPNQTAAVISFAYNVGLGALHKSTLLRKLNAKDYAGAAREFGKWTRGGGQVLRGLVRRRAAERALFES